MEPEKKIYTMISLEKTGFIEPAAALSALEAIMESNPGPEADHILKLTLAAPSPDEALTNLAAIIKTQGSPLIRELSGVPEALSRLIFLLGASPFLARLLQARPELLQKLFLTGGLLLTKGKDLFLCEIRAALKAKEGGEADETKKTLRLYKQVEFLRLGARDLLGLAQMEETTKELSDLASAMLDAAIEVAQQELEGRFGSPCLEGEDKIRNGFAVIGLGKHGADELNYSSDIDIMYICESVDGKTSGSPDKSGSPITRGEFYVKLARKVTALLGEVTADGLVFRVDLALRPGGGSGALVQSLTGAELYYEAQGREWERAAMIKANCVAGDRETGRAFLEMIRPFVFRRNLDLTAIEEIRGMKENIDLAISRQGSAAGGDGGKGGVAGMNVKLGRGGIREIEFFAQVLQLIHGGKNTELRPRGTLAALQALVEKGLVKADDGDLLSKAYVYLRNLEHRLQIVECRQTHTLIEEEKELKRTARLMGFMETEPFLKELQGLTDSVHNVFRGLFYKASSADNVDQKVLLLFSPEIDEDERRDLLHEMGFGDAAAALEKLELLRKGPAGLRRTSARSRAVFEKAAPYLLSKILAAPDPDLALNHLESFISSAGARSTQYALLMENQPLAEKLIYIFGASEFLSRGITARPEDLYLLLSQDLSKPLKTKEEFLIEFSEQVLSEDKGLEDALDAMRRVRNAEVLRIGLNHLSEVITPQEVSTQMTHMAEAALHTAWQVALKELSRVYAAPVDARFAIIGLGKLGAEELGYGSDLDIIFIYEPGSSGAHHHENHEKEITAFDFFVRLSQRIISALAVKTREGSVFEVDTRLRPSGSAGPLVVSLDAFLTYHRSSTALWEKQAFIRARYVAGDISLGEGAVSEVKKIIFSKPLTTADVLEMTAIRKRMEDEIGKETSLRYNFKTGQGGLVDIEFLVQALQLRWGGQDRSVRTPGTITALLALSKGGFINAEDHAFLREAYAFMRRLEMGQRIKRDRPETFLSKEDRAIGPLARALGYGKAANPGAALLADYARITAEVRKIYIKTLASLSR